MKFLRLDKTKGSGAPAGSRYAYLVCVGDIESFPPTDEKGVRLLGDIELKEGTSMMPIYLSNSSQEYSYESTGADDGKSHIVRFSGTHPGTEIEALEFAKNKIEESYIILIPSCNKDEPWKVLGEIQNPMVFTSSHKSANTGSKFTFSFEQKIGSEFLYFMYGGTITQPGNSDFDPTRWARVDASNIDAHVEAWRKKLDIQQNTTYQTIQSGSSTNFSIDYDGVMTRFRIVTNIDVPKTLLSINFNEETDKAVEFLIFNDTNLNINVPASASLGLSKGFSLNTPFAILPKSYALLKYNPDADLLEFWKVNSSGFALPITGNTGDVLEKDPTAVSGAKWTDRFSGLTANFLSFWNGSKFINSIISQVSGKIGIGTTSPSETLDVNGRVRANALIIPPNTSPNVAYRLWSDGTYVYYDNGLAIPKRFAYVGEIYEHQIKSKRIEATVSSGAYTIDLDKGTHFAIALTSATVLSIVNIGASDETKAFTMTITGAFLETLPTGWVRDTYSDVTPNLSKSREYNIIIKRGGSSPLVRFNMVNV